MEDLEMKRPGSGISPMDIKMITGRSLNKKINADTMLNLKDLL
jgi:sialic acid synthase SpsE